MNIKRYFATVLAIAGTLGAMAVPAKPGLVAIEQPDGTEILARISGDEYCHTFTSVDGTPLRSEGGFYVKALAGEPGTKMRMRAPARAQGLFPGNDFPRTGVQKGLVILVEYTDVAFMSNYNPHEYYTRMLNEEGFADNGATGSARDYFVENSGGKFLPDFDVFGPVTLPHPQAYYGGNGVMAVDLRGYEMVIDACELLDDEIDFTEYDRDHDGTVDNIFIIYAGRGEASGGGDNTVWPHSANLLELRAGEEPIVHDGVTINSYACANERQSSVPDGIGTFVHEFSHVLGLPDLYATSSNFTGSTAFTPGEWSVMDHGPYNNNSRTPPYYSVFELAALGWLDPVIIDSATSVRLEDITAGTAYKIENKAKPTEYFLIENRQRKGWDTYLPGHGMLVWHIDYDPTVWVGNVVNNTANHQYVDLIEADGFLSADSRDGDCFPGTAGVTAFDDRTNPAMRFWDNSYPALPLSNITETAEGVITFDVAGGIDGPSPVAALEATDVHSGGFTARWEESPEAVRYLLTVSDADGALEGYTRIDCGKVAQYAVTGLQPLTAYSYEVSVITLHGESRASNAVSVTTLQLPLAQRAPEVLEAAEVSADGFTARWEALDGAEAYLLSVYTRTEGEPLEAAWNFDGFPAAAPEGWATSSKATYSMASMAGAAIPSLRLNNSGEWLRTPEYTDGLHSIAFWSRAASGTEGRIVLEALVAGEWSSAAEWPVTTETGGATLECTAIPAGATALRISFIRESERGTLAIDDVVLRHGKTVVRSYVAGFNDADAGTATSMVVTGLEPEADYFYTVKAVGADGSHSLESAEAAVRTAASGIGSVAAAKLSVAVAGLTIAIDGAEGGVAVYDSLGRLVAYSASESSRVAVPVAGVYIVRTGTGLTYKAICR